MIALGQRNPAERVLIDARALEDKVNAFNVLHLINRYPAASKTRRIAVLELAAQKQSHEFHETAATNRGFTVRHFTDAAQAASWLRQRGP